MNKLNNLDKKKKIILISSIITLIILGIASATVAYFAWVGDESSISVTVIGGEGECSVKEDNNVFLEPTDTKNNGRIIKFTAKQTLAQEAYIVWTMKINKVNELNHNTFRYEMINTTTGVSYGSGDFADVIDGSFIRFRNDQEILTINQTYEFALYLWIDGTIGNNPVTMAGKDLDFDMNCTMFDNIGEFDSVTIIEFIKHQYVKGIPTLITQKDTEGNEIANYYYSYQDSEQTWGLMNDGFKIDTSLDATTTGLATTVTDTTALTSGTEGNIRYFGKNPNNYIYFNCDEYPSTNCEKWKIIGIVDGKVKLIRNESIGDYSWDNKDITTGAKYDVGSNDWSEARLMKLLNSGYDNEEIGGSLYWNGKEGTCYAGQNNATKPCDFTSSGLKNYTTRSMISESKWYLGGGEPGLTYPNQIYTYERKNEIGKTIYGTNPYTIDAEIGLMYASDYGYATDLTKCSQTLFNYNSSTDLYACRTNNWLHNSNEVKWLITPYLKITDPEEHNVSNVMYIHYEGHTPVYSAFDDISIYPVLYLDKEVMVNNKGDGSSDNPYQIEAPNTAIY